VNSGTDLFEDVKSLVASEMEEARRRTILSRGYYTVYHGFLETPCGQQFSFDKEKRVGIHAQLLDYLKQTSHDQQLQARAVLKRMYARRILADYNLSSTITANELDAHLKDLDRLFSFFNTASNPTTSAGPERLP
jgi:hypothetical protein